MTSSSVSDFVVSQRRIACFMKLWDCFRTSLFFWAIVQFFQEYFLSENPLISLSIAFFIVFSNFIILFINSIAISNSQGIYFSLFLLNFQFFKYPSRSQANLFLICRIPLIVQCVRISSVILRCRRTRTTASWRSRSRRRRTRRRSRRRWRTRTTITTRARAPAPSRVPAPAPAAGPTRRRWASGPWRTSITTRRASRRASRTALSTAPRWAPRIRRRTARARASTTRRTRAAGPHGAAAKRSRSPTDRASLVCAHPLFKRLRQLNN